MEVPRGVACLVHDLTHFIKCGHCAEAETIEIQKELTQAYKKISLLKQLLLLTHESVGNVEMNDLTKTQWLAYIQEFPEEGRL